MPDVVRRSHIAAVVPLILLVATSPGAQTTGETDRLGEEAVRQTAEGRVLCVFLALYAFAVFGYVTAALATFFVGRDAENAEAELAGAGQLAALQAEVSALREDIRALSRGRRGL